MKTFAALVLVAAAASAATHGAAEPPAADSELRYVVFLRPDPDRKTIPLEERQRIQDAHMANIKMLASEGVLVAAGPMEDTPTAISGIFIFKGGLSPRGTRPLSGGETRSTCTRGGDPRESAHPTSDGRRKTRRGRT